MSRRQTKADPKWQHVDDTELLALVAAGDVKARREAQRRNEARTLYGHALLTIPPAK